MKGTLVEVQSPGGSRSKICLAEVVAEQVTEPWATKFLTNEIDKKLSREEVKRSDGSSNRR